jgi:hypothetical protein
MTRISDDSLRLNGYASHAGFGTFGPNTVTSNLIRMTNGVISGEPSDTSDTFAINMDSSNLHLEMESIGDFITASYWGVMEGGGHPFLTTLSIQDSMFTSGGVELFGFADGSEKSIFFDDIQVVQIPEPKPLLLLIVSTSLLLRHVRGRTARQGENYG